MEIETLTLRVEGHEFAACATEIATLMQAYPPWLRWLALEVFEHLDNSVDLIRLDDKCKPALGASEFRIGAKPGEKLLRLLAALRAGNGQGGIGIDPEFHGGTYAK